MDDRLSADEERRLSERVHRIYWYSEQKYQVTINRLRAGEMSIQELGLLETVISQIHGDSDEQKRQAINTLKETNWLYDGSLQGISFSWCTLPRLDLTNADLRLAKLNYASLQEVILRNANLYKVAFITSDLEGADLTDANLQGAGLVYTNLQNANLDGANLVGTIMANSDLRGVKNIGTAILDESTILPNNRNWTSSKDLEKFIDGTWEPPTVNRTR